MIKKCLYFLLFVLSLNDLYCVENATKTDNASLTERRDRHQLSNLKTKNVFIDRNKIRYTLASKKGNCNLNWIFIPGGPGCDSSYFFDLIKLLDLPGKCWCIDFPGNGSHSVQKDNFDSWLRIFLPMLQNFPNAIVVGHSFGGMLPLLFKECETLLKGFVILNSAPCLWLDSAVEFAKNHQLPDLSSDMASFTKNPCQETFNKALDACMPYYFPKHGLQKGNKALQKIPFSFEPAVWWQKKAVEISYDAKWIPKSVPTMIIGAEFDAITPYSLFEKDKRFDQNNIQKFYIKGAGHLPWIEKPEEIKALFKQFLKKLVVSKK